MSRVRFADDGFTGRLEVLDREIERLRGEHDAVQKERDASRARAKYTNEIALLGRWADEVAITDAGLDEWIDDNLAHWKEDGVSDDAIRPFRLAKEGDGAARDALKRRAKRESVERKVERLVVAMEFAFEE